MMGMDERTRKILASALILVGVFTVLDGWSYLRISYAMFATRGGGCEVTVCDELGNPVEGALVTVLGVEIAGNFYDLNLPAGTTDTRGQTSFGISGDGNYRVKAEKNGLVDVQEVYIGGGAESSVAFTLGAEATPSEDASGA